MEINELHADIVVIGGGSAGTMAAIKAHMAGASVLAITKGPWPSGNSTKALSGYAAAFGHVDAKDKPDVHFGDVVRNGVGLCNQVLVRKWVDAICGLTEEMRGWGLDLIRLDGDNGYHQIPWEGHSHPRMVHHHRVTGKYLMKCLGDRAEELGIRAMSHSIVGGIIQREGRVRGVWAVDYRSGAVSLVHCKAVILATGGYGALYPVGDNVAATTGEGYALAYNAGASMTGMEFGHFLVTPIHPHKLQVKFVVVGFINGLINESNARLYNGRGERFMFRHYPDRGEKGHTSEELSRRICEEIVIGNGGAHGGIYFDASDVPESFRSNERYARMFELAERAGLDLRRQPIELVTYPHDLVGGVRIDEYGRTDVQGLYAAGEVAGGSHGASRFGGSALSDCLVFGAASGEHAADYAAAVPAPVPNAADKAAIQARFGKWERSRGTTPAAVSQTLSQMAFRCLNMVKTPESLAEAQRVLAQVREHDLPAMGVDFSKPEWPQAMKVALEVEGQAVLCELMAAAALERTESRGGYFGGHYRTDFPQQDDAGWRRNVLLQLRDGRMAITHEAPEELEELSDEIRAVMARKAAAPTDPSHYAESE
jgi:succinate dehydrogenase/fumarate reductase flavoprotein subunit